MSHSTRPLILAVLSIVIITIFFSLEHYKSWFRERVYRPLGALSEQLAYMEPQERIAMRMGNSFIISYNIAEYLRKNKADTNALVLMPPVEYVRANGVDFPVPEPAIFYYYTGMKSIGAKNKGAEKANFAIIYQNKNLQMIPITDQNRAEILKLYRQYNF